MNLRRIESSAQSGGSAPVNGLPPAPAVPDDNLAGGFVLGCQAWTFRLFSVLEAIQKTALAGGGCIEFYPGQKLSAKLPGVKFDHHASDEMISMVREQLDISVIRAVNYGVVDIPSNEAGARKVFKFARKFGLYGITTESVGSIDAIENLARQYDIRVGFHNHPRQPLNPFYKNWDPNFILGMVKGRDPRIGATADTGHWLRSGLNPVACLKLLQGRIISMHLKDLNKKSFTAHDVPCGVGVANISAILDELKRQGFTGNISIEYEFHWRNNVSEVAQCVGFVRRYEAGRSEN